MAELFGNIFQHEAQVKSFSVTAEEEVSAYRLAPCIHVDDDPFLISQNLLDFTSVSLERLLKVREFSPRQGTLLKQPALVAADNDDKLIFLQKNLNIE